MAYLNLVAKQTIELTQTRYVATKIPETELELQDQCSSCRVLGTTFTLAEMVVGKVERAENVQATGDMNETLQQYNGGSKATRNNEKTSVYARDVSNQATTFNQSIGRVIG